MPKISVIVPVHNGEKYLFNCITSIINQSFDDLEIIVIDDGSTDNSYNILNKLKEKYPQIKIVQNNENLGISTTRNKGIQQASGEYISFVDDDDYLNPSMYQDMYQDACSNNFPDIITTGFLFVKDDNYFNKDLSFFAKRNGKKVMSIEEKKKLLFDISPACWNKIYKKDLVTTIPFLDNKWWEDYAFTYSALISADEIVISNNLNYFYRKSNEGESYKWHQIHNHLLDIFDVNDNIEANAKKYNKYDLYKTEIHNLQLKNCLARIADIFRWNIPSSDLESLIQYMNSLIVRKYGNWQHLDNNFLSQCMGINELETTKNILLNEDNLSDLSIEEIYNLINELISKIKKTTKIK